MTRSLRLVSTLICVLPFCAQAQSIPVRAVATPAISSEHFKNRPDVRALPNGKLLVNDRTGKRLLVFDSTMSTFSISADSSGSGNGLYPGPFPGPLMPFAADSSLILDFAAHTFVVIDPAGRMGHALAHPKSEDLLNVGLQYATNTSGDNSGRLIYRASSNGRPTPKLGDPRINATRDTIGIVRADFNTRTVDTLATYTVPHPPETQFAVDANGKRSGARLINPLLGGPDEFAVMPDGTLAIVREHDYHVDWTTPEGVKSSSPKMPFDWKRLTDDDKIARIDSMKRVIDSVNATGRAYGMAFVGVRLPEGGLRTDTVIPKISFVPLNEISDYVPPIRSGSVQPDADGNLWILPTTSAAGGTGLLYDVVNRKGELFQRVRIPVDCVVVGHGKGNVVYLARNEKSDNSWVLGRTRLTSNTTLK